MTILHVHDENDSMAARYVDMLVHHTSSEGTMRVATTLTDFEQQCQEHHPDVVHLHAMPTFQLPAGHRLVVTPHGQPMGPVSAFAIVARSPMEQQQLAAQFQRVEVVRNPLITRTTTPDDCARQMMAIYQKVMHSSVWQLIGAPARQALGIALAAATYGDARWVQHLLAPATFQLDPHQFQLLYIYARHEGVLPQLCQGLQMLQVEAPPPSGDVPCYLPPGFRQPEGMGHLPLTDLLADIQQNGPCLLRMTEVARLLHDDHLDEERLRHQLEESAQLSFMAALLPLLSERLLLTEGFMPCPPAQGRATQQLRTQLDTRQDIQ